MEEILFTGASKLSPEQMSLLVQHVMDKKQHWAKQTNQRSSKPPPNLVQMRRHQQQEEEVAAAVKASNKRRGANDMTADLASASSSAVMAVSSMAKKAKESSHGQPPAKEDTQAMVVHDQKQAKVKFQIPHPGVHGAQAGCLSDMKFVLTGVFPEVRFVGGGVTVRKFKKK